MATDNKLSVYNIVLIFAIVISPYTRLRFSFFGVAELIFVIAFIKEFNNKLKPSFIFSLFWIIYLFISLLGLVYNHVFLSNTTGTIAAMFFDFSAYTLVLMSCFVMESLINKKIINTYIYLKYIFIISSAFLTVLYIVSLFTPSILGLTLKYYAYFAPLVINIHQFVMFLVPLPFIGILILKAEKNTFKRLLILLLIAFDIKMVFSVGVTKGPLAIYVGVISYVCIRFYALSRILFLALITILVALLISEFDVVKQLAFESFTENDLEGGRAYLYSKAIDVGSESMLIGHGTGPHVLSGHKYWDSHQTFITTYLQTGILGTILLITLFFRIFKKLIYNPALFAACSTVFLYASGGDVLRRLPIWMLLVLFYYYKENDFNGYSPVYSEV